MDFFELLASSFEALTLNKVRTALAGLGIVIGIGAVIALVSLGQATQAIGAKFNSRFGREFSNHITRITTNCWRSSGWIWQQPNTDC